MEINLKCSFKKNLDTTGTIVLNAYNISNYSSDSEKKGLAVFSEIYYEKDGMLMSMGENIPFPVVMF
jgi:hypothetical protein